MVLLTIFTGYVVTSLVLLRYPNLIHRRKEIKFKPRVIGHRGGEFEICITGVKAGVEMLELDCQLTKDEQVVVCHDNDLERIAGYDMLVSDTDYEDLPPMKQNLHVSFSKGVKKITCAQKISRVVDGISQTFLSNCDCLMQVSDLVKEYKREEITVWGNANQQIVDKCYKQNPLIPVMFSMRKVVTTTVFFYLGVLPFLPIKASFIEIPMPMIFKKFVDIDTKYALLISIMDTLLMSKQLFQHLNKRGIQVYVWVLNEEKEWERALDLGATGIMTDYPTHLKEFMRKNNNLIKPWA
uniref:Glycerophosphodiester phosphodiesterase domain-containing protein 1-like n=1 Tax=Saccoglossus kowalevskii TaxID=10224 RepID=A0ABM0MZ78_SACKO|nr:PREDICTED: glycerophosphodiester phosphodiesterase domain-containing protein 1-like [Saccoglossus kowalevskii]